ncbi:MAG: hypothetical protein GY861_19280 [bacterium]|nr:hypothetical protein [bacterium]
MGNNEEFDGQIYDLAIYRNKALSASEVLAIHNGGAKTGATAHWDFSDASGSTLTDIVGSNNGTITGAKWLTSGSTYITKVTADDTPRFTQGYYDDSGYTSAPGLLLEGASTNLITHGIFDADAGSGLATGWSSSDNVTNAPTFSLVEEDFTNISGSQAQRWQQTFGDGTYAQIFQQTAVGTVAQGETVTISVWLKGTLTGITSLKLRMLEMDASSVGGTNHLSSDIKGDISATEWRRFSYTITASDADASLVRAYPSVANHSGSGSIDLQIAGAQVEQAAYPSSLIPTTASALTRNIEALSYPVASNFVGGTDGSIALVYRPIMLPDEQGSNYRKLFLVTVDASNAWQYGYRTNADDKIRLSTISGGPETYAESSAEPFSSSRYGLHSIIGTYSTTADASSKKLNNYIDGSLDGTNANYTVPVGSLPAAFQIQSSDNQAMILTGIALFNKRLDATQAAKVDSILT